MKLMINDVNGTILLKRLNELGAWKMHVNRRIESDLVHYISAIAAKNLQLASYLS